MVAQVVDKGQADPHQEQDQIHHAGYGHIDKVDDGLGAAWDAVAKGEGKENDQQTGIHEIIFQYIDVA
ncbi:hypothetical protein GCM10022394_17900 [Zobellella aerophila]|uniref:Uncharacterized protein n=1 Tax=Zobellella aerophila TaxID=870480 RepID=A0ABP6VPI1_9GAMM